MRALFEYFPILGKVSDEYKKRILEQSVLKKVDKGELVFSSSACLGLLIIKDGQLRAYIDSGEGRQITLYRLLKYDICFLTAPCVIKDIQFEIFLEAEKDSEFFVLPPSLYKEILSSSLELSNYTNSIMASRFSDIMWLLNQILFNSLDKRLSSFLIEESNLEGGTRLDLTHEKIASHIGSAREVVSRMLKYFQQEGILEVRRGSVEILDMKRLVDLVNHF